MSWGISVVFAGGCGAPWMSARLSTGEEGAVDLESTVARDSARGEGEHG